MLVFISCFCKECPKGITIFSMIETFIQLLLFKMNILGLYYMINILLNVIQNIISDEKVYLVLYLI